MKKVAVIGGGIIGLFTAYYLKKSGHQVTIVDKGDMSDNCSFGNAGLIVPSHVVPLASPGMVTTALKTLYKPNSTVVFKIPPTTGFMQWSMKFLKSANHNHVVQSSVVLKELSLLSKDLYRSVVLDKEVDFKLEENGLLMVCRSEKVKEEEVEAAEIANKVGIEAKVLSGAEMREKEPELAEDVAGGVFYPGDCNIVTYEVVNAVKKWLEENEVSFLPNTSITGFEGDGQQVKHILFNGEKHDFDDVVITAGVWSNELLKLLNTSVPLQPGKGYTFEVPNSVHIKNPSLLIDHRMSVTPFPNGDVRFGGGMELGHFHAKISDKRVSIIQQAISLYYPKMSGLSYSDVKIWQGHRPCSFDGLPYIGPVNGHKNVFLAAGHSMMGMTLAPATGKLITQLINEQPTSMDVAPFRLNR